MLSALALLTTHPAAAAPAATVPEAAWQKLPAHPRLFADDARFAALRSQRDPVTLQMRELLRARAEIHLATALTVYPAESNLFVVREMQDRVLTLAMMFRLTGEKRYGDRARQELLHLAAQTDWGTGHFLDAGESCLAAGVGLDWLYDGFTPAERDAITRAIVERALRPSLEAEEGKNGWIDGDYNWNQVCNAGLSVGALAIAEREPELARRIVDRAVKNVPNASAVYAPDGSYPEGPSYWSYGTVFHVMLVEALRGALGTSAGLEQAPGFLKSADFKLQMVAPSGGEYDYSDYHHEDHNESVMFWFARELGRRDLTTAEVAALAERVTDSRVAAPGASPAKRLITSRHLALELLWWNPELPTAGDSPSLPRHWTAGGTLPLAVLRSAWNDPRATYLAIKGGTPNHSHAHMDVGSFILEMNGVRWALDLGTESYDRMRAAKLDLWNYSQGSSRWTTFRVGPEGHNIPRFDGAPQVASGKAEIRALPDEGGVMGNVVELSPLYRGQVENVQRQVRMFPDRSVTVVDEWKTGARAVTYTFQWLTRAKVTVLPPTPGLLRLEQGGETLHLRVESPGEFQVESEDVSGSRAPQDSPNPGLSRIRIRQACAAGSAGRLQVTAAP